MKSNTGNIVIQAVSLILIFLLIISQVYVYLMMFSPKSGAENAESETETEEWESVGPRTVRLKHIKTDDWLEEDAKWTDDEIEKIKEYYHKVYYAVLDAGVTETMTETECWQHIEQWICDNTEYDYDYQYYYWNSIFDQRKCVCNGYAQLADLMCRVCGIECYKVDGLAGEDDVSHAWNYICLDGIWYWVDVTWADVNGQKYGLSEALWDDHTPTRMYHSVQLPNFKDGKSKETEAEASTENETLEEEKTEYVPGAYYDLNDLGRSDHSAALCVCR